VQLDGKAARLLDRVVGRAGIDDDDLVDDSRQRSKARFDEPRFVANDQGRRQSRRTVR
jgi:hypothetical protein